MPIQVNSVSDSGVFPEKVDAVVIGAGIIGTCSAYELARKGLSVALIEKGMVAGEQSSRNWGWVRQQNRDLKELPLAIHSLQRWGELGDEIGADLGFRRTGILLATTKQEELDRWNTWSDGAREIGFVNERLTARQASEHAKGSTPAWIGGIWSVTDGRAEPSMAVPAIAEAAKKLGVLLHQKCAVRGLEVANGKVKGVWTERGLIRADAVVVAGGAWSGRLLRRHGVELPVANVQGTAFRTKAAPQVIEAGCLNTGEYALRRRLDGGYTISVPGRGTISLAPQGIRNATKFYQMYRSNLAKKLKYRINGSFFKGPDAWGSWEVDEMSPFEQIRVMDPTPDASLVELGLSRVIADFPALKGMEVAAAWGGLIDSSPDLIPVISKSSKVDGLVIASSCSGHGFGIGPGAGRLVSELVRNETPFLDISPYRLERFSDGSAIQRPGMM